MSKSIRNIVVPKKIMDQLGGDILRLWVSSVDYQSDVRIKDYVLKQVAEVYVSDTHLRAHSTYKKLVSRHMITKKKKKT